MNSTDIGAHCNQTTGKREISQEDFGKARRSGVGPPMIDNEARQ
jgi:hypothetical protein